MESKPWGKLRETVEALLSRVQTAEILGLKSQTLAAWVSKGDFSLPIVRVGSRVMYRPGDVEAFISRNTVSAEAK